MRAEVHHVEDGSSMDKHLMELHTVVEFQGIGANDHFESTGLGGGLSLTHMTCCSNMLYRASYRCAGTFL